MTVDQRLVHLQTEVETAAERLGPDLDLRFRAMFGGIGAYAEGRMFASLSGVGLALKLSPENRSALLREEGAAPLRYERQGPVSKTYVLVPSAIRRDPATLAAWLRRSIDDTAAMPPSKRRARPGGSRA